MSKTKQNATIEFPHGVTVHCPENGGKIDGLVAIDFNGGQITCTDARSLATALSMTMAQYVSAIVNRKQGDGKQGSGPERAWAEAREYAKTYNKGKPESERITDNQARKILSDQKKKQKLEALLKKNPPARSGSDEVRLH
jgi:hypothetical protein